MRCHILLGNLEFLQHFLIEGHYLWLEGQVSEKLDLLVQLEASSTGTNKDRIPWILFLEVK